MPERFRNIALVALIAAMAVSIAALIASDPTPADRVESIGQRIKCPVCQGESIADSPAQMARDMMSLVEERVTRGVADEEIIGEVLDSYTGAVLLDPPLRGSTLILWIAPFAALAVGIAVVIWWRRHPAAAQRPGGGSAPPRRLVPLIVLVVAFAATVVIAGSFIQERGGAASGVADLEGQDLSDVSNETMEAVIAANSDHPQVDGMRLALADRYFETGDYRSAFPHYLAIAESGLATEQQAAAALIRLGWMAWDGNAEAEAALGLLDQALAIDERSVTGRYLKARVLWCGLDDIGAASTIFEDLLAEDVDDATRQLVADDLERARSGEDCS